MLVRANVICISLVAIGLLFAATGKAEIDPDSIAGLWLFDEGAGDEAADISGNEYHGDLQDGPYWVDGVFGKALEFNGPITLSFEALDGS